MAKKSVIAQAVFPPAIPVWSIEGREFKVVTETTVFIAEGRVFAEIQTFEAPVTPGVWEFLGAAVRPATAAEFAAGFVLAA